MPPRPRCPRLSAFRARVWQLLWFLAFNSLCLLLLRPLPFSTHLQHALALIHHCHAPGVSASLSNAVFTFSTPPFSTFFCHLRAFIISLALVTLSVLLHSRSVAFCTRIWPLAHLLTFNVFGLTPLRLGVLPAPPSSPSLFHSLHFTSLPLARPAARRLPRRRPRLFFSHLPNGSPNRWLRPAGAHRLLALAVSFISFLLPAAYAAPSSTPPLPPAPSPAPTSPAAAVALAAATAAAATALAGLSRGSPRPRAPPAAAVPVSAAVPAAGAPQLPVGSPTPATRPRSAAAAARPPPAVRPAAPLHAAAAAAGPSRPASVDPCSPRDLRASGTCLGDVSPPHPGHLSGANLHSGQGVGCKDVAPAAGPAPPPISAAPSGSPASPPPAAPPPPRPPPPPSHPPPAAAFPLPRAHSAPLPSAATSSASLAAPPRRSHSLPSSGAPQATAGPAASADFVSCAPAFAALAAAHAALLSFRRAFSALDSRVGGRGRPLLGTKGPALHATEAQGFLALVDALSAAFLLCSDEEYFWGLHSPPLFSCLRRLGLQATAAAYFCAAASGASPQDESVLSFLNFHEHDELLPHLISLRVGSSTEEIRSLFASSVPSWAYHSEDGDYDALGDFEEDVIAAQEFGGLQF